MIKVICVGKLKEKYWKDAVEEYRKRLKKYTKLEIIEVTDYATDSIAVTQKKEKEEIIKHISDKDFVITMEIEGQMYHSVELSQFLDQTMSQNSNITFVIGGSYGLADEIKQRSNHAISFSKLTFPHQLFRILLLEQIYRSYKIMKNESYHK